MGGFSGMPAGFTFSTGPGRSGGMGGPGGRKMDFDPTELFNMMFAANNMGGGTGGGPGGMPSGFTSFMHSGGP